MSCEIKMIISDELFWFGRALPIPKFLHSNI